MQPRKKRKNKTMMAARHKRRDELKKRIHDRTTKQLQTALDSTETKRQLMYSKMKVPTLKQTRAMLFDVKLQNTNAAALYLLERDSISETRTDNSALFAVLETCHTLKISRRPYPKEKDDLMNELTPALESLYFGELHSYILSFPFSLSLHVFLFS